MGNVAAFIAKSLERSAVGVEPQPQSGFPASRETEKLRSCNVDPIRTPPPAAPPLSALYARQRRTLQHRVNRNNKRQKKRPLNHKLSTITLLRNKKKRRTIEMRPFSNYGKTITILLHLQKYATNPGSVPMPDST